jgi:hypothetical protein
MFRGLFASLVLVAAPLAPAHADWPSRPKVTGDPNEKVCEDVTQVGSRLATKRICATRAEWAEKRKQDKEIVDQAQRSANIGCAVVDTHGGTPAC